MGIGVDVDVLGTSVAVFVGAGNVTDGVFVEVGIVTVWLGVADTTSASAVSVKSVVGKTDGVDLVIWGALQAKALMTITPTARNIRFCLAFISTP